MGRNMVRTIEIEEIQRVCRSRASDLIASQEAGFIELSKGHVYTAPVQHLDFAQERVRKDWLRT